MALSSFSPAKFKMLREAARMSQAQLALRAGVSRPYIVELERGAYRNPGRDKIEAIARALGKHVDDFYDDVAPDGDSVTFAKEQIHMMRGVLQSIDQWMQVTPNVPQLLRYIVSLDGKRREMVESTIMLHYMEQTQAADAAARPPYIAPSPRFVELLTSYEAAHVGERSNHRND